MLDDLEFRGVLQKFNLLNVPTLVCVRVLNVFESTADLRAMSDISSVHVFIHVSGMNTSGTHLADQEDSCTHLERI